jgi:signal transduction histidine kinase
LISEEQKMPMIKDIQTFLATGQSGILGQRIEITGLREDGPFPLEINMAETRMETEVLFTLAVQDIMLRKQSEAERLKISKLESVSLIASGIAHDYNNIMTSVLGYISFAQMDVEQGSAVYDRLSEAEQAARGARQLTSQLLSYSKNNTSGVQSIDISTLAEDAAAFVLHKTQTTYSTEVSHDLWKAMADPTQMTQVFHNLLINAEQAMDSHGAIHLKLDNIRMNAPTAIQGVMLNPGPYLRIQVIDQGPGIPPDQVEKIFDPYFTTKETGTGLGLTTVHTLMTQHSGAISINSILGEGTTITLFLPASMPVSESMDERLKDRILIIDKDSISQKLIKQGLSQFGYEVTTVEECTQAVSNYVQEMEAGRPYKAVVIDIMASHGKGADEVVAKIHSMDPGAVLVGTLSSEDTEQESFSHHYCGYISKPYRVQELVDIIQ